MDAIVNWDRDSAQWSMILAAHHNRGAAPDVAANPLWSVYAPLIHNAAKRSFVLGQVGQSLDGRIATAGGQSHYINGPAAIVHLHRLRTLMDAVVIGVGTAIADDPQLTVRHAATGTDMPQPARVVIDPNGRLPESAKCLRDDGARRIVVQANNHARPKGVECVRVEPSNGHLAPGAVLVELSKIGLNRILVEGGASTLSQFLGAGRIDRLHVMVAPMILGSGPMGIGLPPIANLDEALRPAVRTFSLPGGDILFDCALSAEGKTP